VTEIFFNMLHFSKLLENNVFQHCTRSSCSATWKLVMQKIRKNIKM